MKTLMNCNAKEFLVQTNKMRKKVEKLVKAIDFDGISANFSGIVETATAKEKVKKIYPILSNIMDICFEKDVDTVLEIVAMARFEDVAETEKLEPNEIMNFVQEMIQSERVINFFTSSAKSVGSITAILSRILT